MLKFINLFTKLLVEESANYKSRNVKLCKFYVNKYYLLLENGTGIILLYERFVFCNKNRMRQKKSDNAKNTQINVYLDAESNKLLEQSLKLSYRTKRQEATIRIADHLKRFKSGEFASARISYESKVTHVNILLDSTENALLIGSTDSYMNESITKREEASIRLKDHLLRFKGIAFIGMVIER